MRVQTTLLILLFLASRGVSSAGTDVPATGGATNADSTLVSSEDSSNVAQRDAFDLLDKILGRRVEPQVNLKPRTGLQWSLLPTFSYNPVYGAAIGVMMSGAGRRGSARARYSSLSVSGNVSSQGQVQIQVRGEVFSPSENYLTKADFRYLDTERSTWGLGPIDHQSGEYPMSFLLNRAYATFLRKTSGPVFVGVGIHYDEFSNIIDQRAENGESTPYFEYSSGLPSTSRAVGLSVNLLADTRDNLVNPQYGYYLSGSFRDYLTSIGSDHEWQEFLIEARVYPHLPARSGNVLAFWISGWMTFGQAPYLNLPANGWDTYGRGARGYVAGRIRGTSQIYVESEYRWSLTRDGLWGAAAFVNGTTTTTADTGTFARMDIGVGAGLRIKFNKHTSTNLTLDYGWGQADSHGFFLGMNEVF